MPRIAIPYGPASVTVEVPDGTAVLEPLDRAGLDDPGAEIAAKIAAGVPSLAGKRVVVVFPDITRPMPNKVVLPPLLSALEAAGAERGLVRLLCATGTHRPATPEELEDLVGADLLARYQIHQHDASDDESHAAVGEVDRTRILLDRLYVDADVRITTGLVEPHFFAGWSGGPKGVCPGLAALETVLEAHRPARIAHPSATWLELDDNPVHRFVSAGVDLLPPDLSVDVAVNNSRQVTAVFVGPLPDSHRRACQHVRETALHQVDEPFDVVVAGNTGLPLDRNLYQAVKGMAAAERIVRAGGDIVMLASCVDGFPEDGPFPSLARAATSPTEMAGAGMDGSPLPAGQDTWQTQVLGRILTKARVHLHTGGLSDDDLRSVHLDPMPDPSALVGELLQERPDARVCVLPQAPLTVATLAGRVGT